MSLPNHNPFVFHDPAGKRWPRLRIVGLFIALVLFIALTGFIQSLLVNPQLRLPSQVRQLKGQLRALQAQTLAQPKVLEWQKYTRGFKNQPLAKAPLAPKPPAIAPHPNPSQGIRAGFFSDWDPAALRSFTEHASQLTHLCVEWGTVTDGEGALSLQEISPQLARVSVSQGVTLIPILNNLVGRQWQPEAIEGLANGPADRRGAFIVKLLSAVQEAKVGGVLLDWEQLNPADRSNLTSLVEQLATALHAINKELWFLVPMNAEINTFDLGRLTGTVDHFVASLCDETSEDEPAGPIASQDWFEGWLSVIDDYGYPERWIATIGAYGYDWNESKQRAEEISFRDAMSRASFAGVKNVKGGAPSFNPIFSYEEPGGKHTVCFLDAITFLNQLRAVKAQELGGIAIQRLGQEDPQIWDVLNLRNIDPPDKTALDRFRKMKTSDDVTNVGQGEVITVDDTQDDGVRDIQLVDGRYVAAYTNDFPTYPTVFHEGAGDEHAVTLTFDDGPDPKWTPKILDILKAHNLKAAFFILGIQAENNPDLVRRIINEGHEIGNHTYTHPNISEVSPKQIQLEFNATQFLLESITGHSTILCRPPYNADSNPARLKEILPLKQIQDDLDYLIVMENIDPEDWARPGTEAIIDRIKEQRDMGNIILLHDAGGNRSQTVEALPRIIDYLETRGDHIVSLSELLHIPRDELMPPVSTQQPYARMVTSLGFSMWHRLEQFLWAFMIAATGLVVVRGIIVALLAARHHHCARKVAPAAALPHPPLSIVIAAYNEAKVIQSTIESVLNTAYEGEIELIVVDDGSTDTTADIVRRMAAAEPRLHFYSQANGGKSTALRTALLETHREIIVFLDADTRFERGTLAALIAPFADETVGAVSGHAKVGNLRSFIARCQDLEYTCGFNLDRRAYAQWNCITVAPGAISALKRTALDAAGGFSLDTLAEDTDLTLCLHRVGFRVAYAHDAIAWTEAPETFRTLAKQRFRWAFGTLQCLWKHADLVFNPDFKALGWFALPSMWFCQILLVAITPMIDLLLIFSLLTGNAAAMGIFFAAFMAMDMLLAVVACAMDDEPLVKSWIILPMRLIYRPLLSWVVWKAILKAFKGAWVTWGKLERTASVEVKVS
jgi:cellulose synthase/poly-beta-1,6-N-acetylglucosamine synthase-like glycosyltransferase/peptidoglycan/xylan/chitin deacetylase (PgdA/CDA1 family)/spore germination protein YaaH